MTGRIDQDAPHFGLRLMIGFRCPQSQGSGDRSVEILDRQIQMHLLQLTGVRPGGRQVSDGTTFVDLLGRIITQTGSSDAGSQSGLNRPTSSQPRLR
ncbi:MAG: hypothetical protein JWM76_3338 [Pseudonocardiales bacterium]|nr:hypothetical protein [Pseudonocardiales bacterium]